jgi:hypothetical protein
MVACKNFVQEKNVPPSAAPLPRRDCVCRYATNAAAPLRQGEGEFCIVHARKIKYFIL